MKTTHWILHVIWNMDPAFVPYGCKFLKAVQAGRAFELTPPWTIKREVPEPVTEIRESWLNRFFSFLKRLFSRKDGTRDGPSTGIPFPQRLHRRSKDVSRTLHRQCETAAVNLAMHNAEVLDLMTRLTCRWITGNLPVIHEPLTDRGKLWNTCNFNYITFSPCGFLAALMAAEAYRFSPREPVAVDRLAEVFMRLAEKQGELKAGDVILIRVFDRYLARMGRSAGQKLFAFALKEFDTLKWLTAPPRDFSPPAKVEWWGLDNYITRSGTAEPKNMTAYICRCLLDRDQDAYSREILAKWTSCLRGLLGAGNDGEKKDIRKYLLQLEPAKRENLKKFCRHFLDMFKRLLFYESLRRMEPEQRKELSVTGSVPVPNFFTQWLRDDLDQYINDAFTAAGKGRSQSEGQRLEREEYNVHYKFVFTALAEILGPDECLEEIESIRYGQQIRTGP